MSKLSKNKPLILNALMAVAVLFIVGVSYSNTKSGYMHLKSCCRKMTQDAPEMPWESVSRHFISLALFR